MMKDLGHELKLRIWTDSSAAIGVCSRQGLGKLRHLDTHLLWIQQAVRSRRIDLRKIDGESNPADIFTKHLSSREKVLQMVRLLGCRYADGRAESAPQRREGNVQKTTMAEANSFTDVDFDGPFMPHLIFAGELLDRYFPSIEAAEDLPENPTHNDLEDENFQYGMKVAEEIRERMQKEAPSTYWIVQLWCVHV